MKKYSLTKTKKEFLGITLFQIKAEMSFGDIPKGDLGGWIEKESNLSHSGNAWVYDNARVSGDAWKLTPLQIHGTIWIAQWCKKGILKIGREEHTIKEWKKLWKKLIKKYNVNKETAAEYWRYVKLFEADKTIYE